MRKRKLKFETVNDTKKMQDAYDEFILSCKARNLVNETIINYSKSIKYFMNYIGPDFNIYNITRADVNSYISEMLEKVQSNTIRSYCKLLKVFFKYFELDVEFDMPSENFHYKDVYSREEIEKLLQPPKRKNFSTMRDHVMVSFLLGTGVRMRTLITLKVKDVDLVNNRIFLNTTKTKKQYYIPMSTQLKRVLTNYLNSWCNNEDDYLFPNQYGEMLSKNALGTLITNYNKSRGVYSRGIHKFRRTFATNYIKNGGDISRLQLLLGHSKIDTTRRYVTLDIQSLQENYDDYNILDTFCNKNKRISLTNTKHKK